MCCSNCLDTLSSVFPAPNPPSSQSARPPHVRAQLRCHLSQGSLLQYPPHVHVPFLCGPRAPVRTSFSILLFPHTFSLLPVRMDASSILVSTVQQSTFTKMLGLRDGSAQGERREQIFISPTRLRTSWRTGSIR